MSGYADFESALDAINEVGVDRLLTKPWQNEEVRRAVDGAAETRACSARTCASPTSCARRTEELERVNQHLDALVEERTSTCSTGWSRRSTCATPRRSGTRAAWAATRAGSRASCGIEGRELDDIERGATLHDIGKIGVRDAVLLKPGPLDEKEWAEMRRHPALGYEILKGIGFLERAR